MGTYYQIALGMSLELDSECSLTLTGVRAEVVPSGGECGEDFVMTDISIKGREEADAFVDLLNEADIIREETQ